MSITAYGGPLGSFGQAPGADYNPQAAASFFYAGVVLLDPRPQFTYVPGNDVTSGVYGWQAMPGVGIQSMYVVPVTKSTTIISTAHNTVSGAPLTLASATTTGLAVGVTVPRQDTGVNVTGLLELDPLSVSCTANVTAGSNILTVTAMGTGSGNNPIGICPGTVLTDSTHAGALASGVAITGYGTGNGGIGTYTMSANALLTETGDTVTGLYTAFPHAVPFGQVGTVRAWNPMAMCSRALVITASSASGTGGVFTVNGLDVFGFPMTEQITSAPASSVTATGVKAWKYIKSITPDFTDASFTYSVGTADIIGFPIRSDRYQVGATVDVAMMMNNALIASATGYTASVPSTPSATTGDVRGTYALQTPSNGTLVFSVNQAPLTPALNSVAGLYGPTQYTAW